MVKLKILLFGKDGQVGKHTYEIIKQKYHNKSLEIKNNVIF